ncbi:putative triacylglycerol lipase 1-like [Capsicum annuum]|nr:putative triacylglycerol lipase 1-like [Capsicum annuum]
MNDIAEVYPELNIPGSTPNDVYSKVMGPDTHGIVRTLGKGAAPSLVYGPVYKRSQAEKRNFDARVELEVQKATSAMKIEMAEKWTKAQKEMKAMNKKLSEAKEEAKKDKKAVERKLSEANMNMKLIIADKVKTGVQAYLESLGITIDANTKSRQAKMIKKTGTSVVDTNKRKWMEPDYSWIYQRNNDNRMGIMEEFVEGVNRFVEHAKTLDVWTRFWAIRCSCVRWDGINLVSEEDVKEHLYRKGFHEDFLRLCGIHGVVAQNNFVVGESSWSIGHNEYQDARMIKIVHDAFGMQHGSDFRKMSKMFLIANSAPHMRWHSENRRPTGVMCHPSDGETWKHFDATYPDFTAVPRNIRLGLCANEFSLFSEIVQSLSKASEEPLYRLDGYGVSHNWTKQGIFWELEYWPDNLLKNNIDVMHTEKTYFDNVFNTVMNVTSKTKDNLKARLDLLEYCKRRELHLHEGINGNVLKPKVSFTFKLDEKRQICEEIGKLKRGPKNKHRVEGSVVEAYLAREISQFCSYYFRDDVRQRQQRSPQYLIPTPTHVGPLHGSTPTQSAFITVSRPSQYYQTAAGTFEYVPSLIPTCSSRAASNSDSAGSIGLSDLQLGGTPSGASDPPTLVHPPSLALQPGDKDDSGRRLGRMLELDKLRENAFVRTSTATGPVGKSEEYQLLRKREKKARASFKGGSLHTAGARSTIIVLEKMDKYTQLISEYRSTQPPESQGNTLPQHVEEELWKKVVGPADRGNNYGYHKKKFGESITRSSGHAYSSSSAGREITERLENTISKLTEELAEQREIAQKKEEETSSQIRMLLEQFSSFIQTAWIIPPCLGDAVRAAKGLHPLDDISTDEDMENEENSMTMTFSFLIFVCVVL